MMRCATTADIPVFKNIWKEIFGDSDTFLNHFFSTNFHPEMSFCAEIDGVTACVMHCRPIKIKAGKNHLSAVMVSGVATLPEYRKKGLMHKLFKYAISELAKQGHYLCYYYPANPAFYTSLGHVHIPNNLLLEDVFTSGIEKTCAEFFPTTKQAECFEAPF